MFDLLRNRRSVRGYEPREVEDEKLDEVLKAGMFSQTAMNRRHWHFIVVKDAGMKQRLAEATIYSAHVAHAPVVIAVCGDETKASRWIEDCSIAAENMCLEATNQGLGTCWTQIREGTSPDKDAEAYVRELLGVPDGMRILCLLPMGYPDSAAQPHGDELVDLTRVHRERF